jgi:hypothetical protein
MGDTMIDWLSENVEVNREITVGYCIADFVFTAIFVLLLILFRRKRELLIGLSCGAAMLVAELIMMSLGLRIVTTPQIFDPVLVLVAIGFDPMLVVAVITYDLIEWGLTGCKDRYHRIILLYFVIGWLLVPLGLRLPMMGETIFARRSWFNFAYLGEFLATTILFFVNYKVFNLKRLTLISFGVGLFVNLMFEGVMMLYGIRWFTTQTLPSFIFLTVFELNAGIMSAIFFLRVFFKDLFLRHEIR